MANQAAPVKPTTTTRDAKTTTIKQQENLEFQRAHGIDGTRGRNEPAAMGISADKGINLNIVRQPTIGQT